MAERNKAGAIHNLGTHPLYPVWKGMLKRCNDSKRKDWPYYGSKGISVCAEWLCGPTAFIRWAEANGCAHGLEIDRIDNEEDYTPDNCRFVTRQQNGNNKRNNVRRSFFGVEMTVAEAARKFEINYFTLWSRIKKGMSGDDAVTRPIAAAR